MPIVLGNGTISGLNVGGLPNDSVVSSDIQTSAKRVLFDMSQEISLVTGIRDSGTTYTRSYDLSSKGFTTYSDTIGVMIKRYYQHNGGSNHGYFSADLYQSGNSNQAVSDDNSHYDWYYNTDEDVFIVPWNPAGNDTIVIACNASHNTSSSNYYDYSVVGQIRAARK